MIYKKLWIYKLLDACLLVSSCMHPIPIKFVTCTYWVLWNPVLVQCFTYNKMTQTQASHTPIHPLHTHTHFTDTITITVGPVYLYIYISIKDKLSR